MGQLISSQSHVIESDKLIRLSTVCDLVGLCKSAVFEFRLQGRFPEPVKLTPGRRGAARYSLSEIQNWIESRKAERSPKDICND